MLFKQAGDFILNKLENELSATFYYHNLEHTKDVYASAERIGASERISDYEMKLLLTAACYHDSGFLNVLPVHERESCNMAKTHLPDFDYTNEEIDRICGMIMATRLPQSPRNKLEEILADADLDYLGRDDFFTIGDKLCLELGFTSRDEWNTVQLIFLEDHKYFTQTALNLRGPKKQDNLQKVRALLQ